MIYKISLSAKIFLVFATTLVTGGIMVMLIKRSYHIIWGVPFYIVMLWVFVHVWQTEIIIEEKQLIQKFGINSKSKIMEWDDIDCVVKDGLDDLPICRLLSKSSNKTKMINIAGIKNMESLIIEIVKRAKNAEIDPAFRELAEKESKK